MVKLFDIDDVVDGRCNQTLVSNETISPQLNDYVGPLIEKSIQSIVDAVNGDDLTKYSKFVRSKRVKKIILELESILLNRFKYNIKMLHQSTGNASNIITGPPVNNTISRYIEYMSEYISSYKPQNDVDLYDRDQHGTDEILMGRTYESMAIIEKDIESQKVVVDLAHATITGISKDYKTYVSFNWLFYIKNNFSVKHMTAVLLHEIGHSYTNIEYVSRVAENVLVLSETLRESIREDGSSKKKAVRLAYERVIGKPAPDTASTNTTIIMMVSEITKRNVDSASDVHSVTDSEQQADNFAARFGYAKEIVEVDQKYAVMFNTEQDVSTHLENIGVVVLLASALLLVSTPLMIGFVILTVIEGQLNMYGDDYDNDARRSQRLINDMIRQLRTSDMDKADIKNTIANIESARKLLAATPIETTRVLNTIAMYTRRDNRKIRYTKAFNELVEDTMENNLHVLGAKLKNI